MINYPALSEHLNNEFDLKLCLMSSLFCSSNHRTQLLLIPSYLSFSRLALFLHFLIFLLNKACLQFWKTVYLFSHHQPNLLYNTGHLQALTLGPDKLMLMICATKNIQASNSVSFYVISASSCIVKTTENSVHKLRQKFNQCPSSTPIKGEVASVILEQTISVWIC